MSKGELDLETRLRQEMEKKDEEIEALKAKAEERRRRQEEDAKRQEEEKARIEAERRQREVFSISFASLVYLLVCDFHGLNISIHNFAKTLILYCLQAYFFLWKNEV